MRSSLSTRSVEAAEHRATGFIADTTSSSAMIGDDKRFAGVGIDGRTASSASMAITGSSLRQQLEPRLRLPRFGGRGAEAINKGLQSLALVFLIFRALAIKRKPFSPLAHERGLAAAIKRKLSRFEMENRRQATLRRSRSWLITMTVWGYRARCCSSHSVAFKIEIIGWLVQQQKVGLHEQCCGKRHAHAPAARELRAGTFLVGMGKTKAGTGFERLARVQNTR